LEIDLSSLPANVCDPDCEVDLFVENLGRINFGKYHHFDTHRKVNISK